MATSDPESYRANLIRRAILNCLLGWKDASTKTIIWQFTKSYTNAIGVEKITKSDFEKEMDFYLRNGTVSQKGNGYFLT